MPLFFVEWIFYKYKWRQSRDHFINWCISVGWLEAPSFYTFLDARLQTIVKCSGRLQFNIFSRWLHFFPFLQFSFFLSPPFTWILKQKAWWDLVQDRRNDSAALDFNFDWFEDVWWKEVNAIIFIAFLMPKLLEDQALPKTFITENVFEDF